MDDFSSSYNDLTIFDVGRRFEFEKFATVDTGLSYDTVRMTVHVLTKFRSNCYGIMAEHFFLNTASVRHLEF